MSEWRRMVEDGGRAGGLPGLVTGADAVLALLTPDAPPQQRQLGAMLVAGALINITRFRF